MKWQKSYRNKFTGREKNVVLELTVSTVSTIVNVATLVSRHSDTLQLVMQRDYSTFIKVGLLCRAHTRRIEYI